MNRPIPLTVTMAAAILVTSCGGALRGEIVFVGSAISENFNSLGSSTRLGVFSTNLFEQSPVPGSTGFEAIKISGTSTTRAGMHSSDGGNTSGGMNTLGGLGQSDRAIGAMASSENTMGFGFSLRNASSATIRAITVSFTEETWRVTNGTTNTLKAEWGTSKMPGMSASSFLFSSALPAVPELDLESPRHAMSAVVDGNLPANREAKSFTFVSLALQPNDRFFLRWSDFHEVGINAALGIDDMTLSFVVTQVPEPSSAALGITVCGAIVKARRRLRGRRMALAS